MDFKTGKLPATKDPRDLKLARYLNVAALPKHPAEFGHDGSVASWGMLGNDQFGDCVFAGAAHETMLWNKIAGRDVAFNDDAVLADYSAVTGFNRNDPATDQGTNVRDALNFRRKTGSLDAAGVRHKIGA